MLIALARRSLADALSPAFRPILARSLGWTLLALAVTWVGLTSLVARLGAWLAGGTTLPGGLRADEAASWGAGILGGLVLLAGLMFLIVPITTLVASLSLDSVAETVERRDYPDEPPGVAMALAPSLGNALRFTGVVVLVNLACLALLLVPGVNMAAFFVGNGYLLGREYFELAALRHAPAAAVRQARQRHAGLLFLAGLVIAGVLAVPVLNLVTPVFATILMVHLNKALRDGSASGALDAAAARR